MSKFDRLKNPSAPSAAASPSRSQLENDFIRVTREYAKQDEIEKEAKKKKDKLRAEFLSLASAAVVLDGLDRKIITLPKFVGLAKSHRFRPTEYVEAFYPGWQIVSSTTEIPKDRKITIEQIASEVPYSYVNNVDRVVLSRQVSMVKSGIDTDWLRKMYPGIAERVLRPLPVEYEFDEEQAVLLLSEDPATQSIFEEVALPGTPQVKMAAPKRLKDDE